MKLIRLRKAASLAVVCAAVLMAAQSARAQTYKVLYSFTGSPDGALPAGVTRDAKGNLYGATFGGGQTSGCGKLPCGVLFKLDSMGKETLLHSFCSQSNCVDGYFPNGGVIRDAKGNLYGTTQYGGAYGYGTIFRLSRAGEETVLYSFCSHPTSCLDGAQPNGALIRDAEGSLYGTTYRGGASNWGTVFKLSKTGQETVLYSFCSTGNCADGALPNSGVIQDAEGNLYGATNLGGGNGEFGTVFKLSKKGRETVLRSFTGDADGVGSSGGLIRDVKGNLYGTTFDGGVSGVGTVFKLTKTGKESVLYSFMGGADGAYPSSGVIRDAKGDLYGTTGLGGTAGNGTAFKLSKTGKESVLYSFTGGTDGGQPLVGVIPDAEGNLYGTTSAGGDLSCGIENSGCGVVFKLTP